MSGNVKEVIEENPVEENQVESKSQTESKIEPVKVDFMSSDVAIVLNIIDVASARGTFRGPEMKGVGEFYEKLQSLLPKKETNA